MQQKLSRKQKRQQKNEGIQSLDSNFQLKTISPKTKNQELAFKSFRNNKDLMLHGLPGTGKTFIALYLALKQVVDLKVQKQVVIVRSAVPTRDIGFMPGNATEKMKYYEAPYMAIVNELFGRADAYEILKQKKQLVFMPTSFIRGLTIDDAVVIIDEAQNMDYQEIRSVITRVGENTRFMVCADQAQDDLTSERFKEVSGIKKFMGIMKKIDSVAFYEFDVDDILRSDFIKSYIMAEYGKLSRQDEVKDLPDFITKPQIVRHGTILLEGNIN